MPWFPRTGDGNRGSCVASASSAASRLLARRGAGGTNSGSSNAPPHAEPPPPVTNLATTRIARVDAPPSPVSTMAAGLVGSEILKIAAEIRAMREQGATICNLTVGDFDPAEFRIPQLLEDGIVRALRAGETNDPPSAGIPALREAVRAHTARAYDIEVPVSQVLVTG